MKSGLLLLNINAATAVIAVILAVVIVIAAAAAVKKFTKGGGCCGEHEETEKRIKVKDRNVRNYPYTAELKIGGMTCDNCARRVENALNGLKDTWATVRIDNSRAVVRTKNTPDEEQIRETVRQAGYVVTEYSSGE